MKRILKIYEKLNKHLIEGAINKNVYDFSKSIKSTNDFDNHLVISFVISCKRYKISFDKNLYYKILDCDSVIKQADIEYITSIHEVIKKLDNQEEDHEVEEYYLNDDIAKHTVHLKSLYKDIWSEDDEKSEIEKQADKEVEESGIIEKAEELYEMIDNNLKEYKMINPYYYTTGDY